MNDVDPPKLASIYTYKKYFARGFKLIRNREKIWMNLRLTLFLSQVNWLTFNTRWTNVQKRKIFVNSSGMSGTKHTPLPTICNDMVGHPWRITVNGPTDTMVLFPRRSEKVTSLKHTQHVIKFEAEADRCSHQKKELTKGWRTTFSTSTALVLLSWNSFLLIHL